MIFTETKLKGAFVIEPERLEDERGFFARALCQREFEAHGLPIVWVQENISFNPGKGTVRGMHVQLPPYSEAKLVRCTMGAIQDVIIDLRRSSPTFGQHLIVELGEDNRRALYIPEEFAHGFQALMDNSEVLYHMSEFYRPESARGIRWDDPAFGIRWPLPVTVISDRDRTFPDFSRNFLIGKT